MSSSGDKVWCGQIQRVVNSRYISRLMTYDFEKKSHFLYQYEHQHFITSVLVSEAFDLAMSGGDDKALVLHDLKSGKMIKRFDMKYGDLQCLFDLGTAVAVGDRNIIRFLDPETREMKNSEVKAGGHLSFCMSLGTAGSGQNDNMALLVGGGGMSKMDKISIPKVIARLGKQILEMRNRPRNTQKNRRKMFRLENENKRLREENQRLRDQLKQEQRAKIDATSVYEKKILELSNGLKTQEAIKARLQEGLKQVKSQLATLESPKRRTNAVKRNLVLRQILRKRREPECKDPDDASSEDSDNPFALNKQEMQERLEVLEKKFRKQRRKIFDLETENDSLQEKRNKHQRLLKNYEKLSQRLKTSKNTNKQVQAFW